MKVALFADPHIHPFTRFTQGQDPDVWVDRSLDVLEKIYDECGKRDIKNIWCLGDLLHVGQRLSTRMWNRLLNFFRQQKEAGFYTTLIAGNHDLVARGGKESALLGLSDVVDRVVEDTYLLRLPG